MSYADVAASGPPQSASEAAAPQPPEIVTSDTVSTTSYIDVDTPSVRAVPADHLDEVVPTEIQEKTEKPGKRGRRDKRESTSTGAHAEEENDSSKKKNKKHDAAVKARQADSFLTKYFADLGDGPTSVMALVNIGAVLGFGSYLGYKAVDLYKRGQLTWQSIGLGAGAFLGLGLVEAALGNYIYKGKRERTAEKS
ncbi:hypothetical protein GGR50DRAFT_66907 [Xylaria sp. CBS 124048]|nr:hypothetical protein GGR50DRAFT_66907 [Xylaria sp. CBS 124048]